MCETCGCGDPGIVPVEMHEKILARNDEQAAHNREHFERAGVLAVNLMGSPGSGKTAILETTAAAPGRAWSLGAISGDLATDNDARRLRAAGIPAAAVTTGSACHLDAELIHHALHDFPCDGLDLLFIENVGNLVCPAVYDLGEGARVIAVSVTEGEDKPLKYPAIFHKADLVLITKVDLLAHLPDVRIDTMRENLERVMPGAASVAISATTGEGLDEWLEWLEWRRRAQKPRNLTASPHARTAAPAKA